MLDLKFIRENTDAVRENINSKNESGSIDLILEFDGRRRSIIGEVEQLKNQRNVVSDEIAKMKKAKENADAQIEAMRQVSDKIKLLDEDLRQIETEQNELLLRIPNMVHSSVPIGKGPQENATVRNWGTLKDKVDLNHLDISKSLNILDFERGAKVSGSGFAFYVGKGAALERALINFMIETHLSKHGYTELMPPFIVNAASMRGTGQLPKMKEDMYHAPEDDMYLIPTAEVPLTNYFAGDMIKFEDFPVKVCGYSPCFRREAGSHGKDVHGFLRVHQFNKVEMVKLSTPENSYDELESLTRDAEDILKMLELPFRTILLCSGDTSFSSAKTYDLEVWSPGEQLWLEVSSCSNFEDFQARRANIRFKRNPQSKPEFVHTLNGSGLATSRIMVAILENYYSGGKVIVPEVLRPYCKFDVI
ncbi:MAG: serS [Ignavibacteria bacterium]|nr:serS [Ignavibacteria bacterium]